MTVFAVICAGLVLLGALFFLWPTRSAQDDAVRLAEANLRWYRLREEELAQEGNDELQEDIRLRLLEDETHPGVPQPAAAAGTFPAWVLLPLVAVTSVGLYYVLGAAQDVRITERLQNFGQDTAPEQVQQLMDDIAVRSAQKPGNLHYIALLGRFYMGREDYERAQGVYERLVLAAPEDGQALAFAAQAEYLGAGRTLTDRARLRAEQALAADPHQRTALSLLGMASFEQGQFRAAISYWQRLLATEPPNSDGARMIASVIERARQQLGGARPAPEAPAVADPASAIGVTVRVALPEGASLRPSDTVFVLARDASSQSRMPIAVRRLTGDQLPLTLRLDDSVSMAGQKLSHTASVMVAVQVSADGRPGEANAKWLGELGPVEPTTSQEPLQITLQPNAGS